MINRQLPTTNNVDNNQEESVQELRDNLALSCYVFLLRMQSIIESMEA